MQISPLGGWLVSALPIPIGREWHNSSADSNPNTNSSILLQCKNKLQVHIKPTPTNQDPKQKYCIYYLLYVLYRILSSVLYVKKKSNKVALATNIYFQNDNLFAEPGVLCPPAWGVRCGQQGREGKGSVFVTVYRTKWYRNGNRTAVPNTFVYSNPDWIM